MVCNDTSQPVVVVVETDANAQVHTSVATAEKDHAKASAKVKGSAVSMGGEVSASGEKDHAQSFKATMSFAKKVDAKKYVIPGSDNAKSRNNPKNDIKVFMPVATAEMCEFQVQDMKGNDLAFGKKNAFAGTRMIISYQGPKANEGCGCAVM